MYNKIKELLDKDLSKHDGYNHSYAPIGYMIQNANVYIETQDVKYSIGYDDGFYFVSYDNQRCYLKPDGFTETTPPDNVLSHIGTLSVDDYQDIDKATITTLANEIVTHILASSQNGAVSDFSSNGLTIEHKDGDWYSFDANGVLFDVFVDSEEINEINLCLPSQSVIEVLTELKAELGIN